MFRNSISMGLKTIIKCQNNPSMRPSLQKRALHFYGGGRDNDEWIQKIIQNEQLGKAMTG